MRQVRHAGVEPETRALCLQSNSSLFIGLTKKRLFHWKSKDTKKPFNVSLTRFKHLSFSPSLSRLNLTCDLSAWNKSPNTAAVFSTHNRQDVSKEAVLNICLSTSNQSQKHIWSQKFSWTYKHHRQQHSLAPNDYFAPLRCFPKSC